MAHFWRRADAPVVAGGYRSFRPYVRKDFVQQCAYCLLAEILVGGEENFELDHFKPRSKFQDLINDYFNIYYSCHPCNRAKHDEWPPPELFGRGIGFVDLCRDEFAEHFAVEGDGSWTGKTDAGRYTIDIVRLNRKHLVEIRGLLSDLGFAVHTQRVAKEELQELARQLGFL